MIARRAMALLLVGALLTSPVVPARAAGDGGGAESKLGVLFMVVCGLALKASIPAPVPWAGVAVMSCLAGLLDAAMSEDKP